MRTKKTNPSLAPHSALSTRRGQYFSFDAIIASVIFILAVSILTQHWFALRAQMSDSSNYLGQDALRASDLLLGVGEPADANPNAPGIPFELNCRLPLAHLNWYQCPWQATRAGYSINGSLWVVLNATQLNLSQDFMALDPDPKDPNTPTLNARYNAYRALLSTGSQFEIIVNTTDHRYDGKPGNLSAIAFGRSPQNAHEIDQVRRSIVILDPDPNAVPRYYYGNLTLILWSNQSAP